MGYCRLTMSPELAEMRYAGRPATKLASDRLSLTVLPTPGGRIISLQLDGTELLYQDPRLVSEVPELDHALDVPTLKRERGWQHYGGDKTWLAPQARWADELPFLDLDSGEYSLAELQEDGSVGVRLISPICRESGIQVTRTIAIDGTNRIQIRLEMTNHSGAPAAWGLWDVTQLGGPGRFVMPVEAGSTNLDDVHVYSNETRTGREALGRLAKRNGDMVVVKCHQAEQFKFGTNSRDGWLLALLDRRPGTIAFLRHFDTRHGSPYPHPSTSEVYDSPTLPYFEMETHGPLIELDPGGSYARSEKWSFDWFDQGQTIPDYVHQRTGPRKDN